MDPAQSPQTSASPASAVSHDSTATWDVISQHVHSLQLEVNLLQSRIRVLEDRCDLADQAQDRLDRRVSLLEHWCQSLRKFLCAFAMSFAAGSPTSRPASKPSYPFSAS